MAKLGKNHTGFKSWNNFCSLAIVCFFYTSSVSAQIIDSVKLKPIVTNPSVFRHFNRSGSFLPVNSLPDKKIQINFGSPFAHWGVMCVGEYKLEQKTGLPLRFRLGSLEYVNKLEGKR